MTLSPSTTYYLVLRITKISGAGAAEGGVEWAYTRSSDVADDSAEGWSIPSVALLHDSDGWRDDVDHYQFEITGSVAPNIATLSIDSPNAVDEGDGGTTTMTFSVRPSAAPDALETVTYSIAGTATANIDYTAPATGTLMFQQDSTSPQTIVVTINGDQTYEEDETVEVTLSGASDGLMLGTAVGTGTITNDDDPPLLEVMAPSVDEGDPGDAAVLSFRITKTGSTDLPVTVGYAITGTATESGNGADFMHTVSSPITIAAIDSSATIDVEIIEDNLAEPDETVIVTLSSHDNHRFESGASTLVSTGMIINDDLLEFSVMNASVTERDAGDTDAMTFTVMLGADTPSPVSVTYTVEDGTATAPDDYTDPGDGTLTFQPGDPLTQTFEVSVAGDTLTEGSETIIVELTNPSCTSCPTGVEPSLKSGAFTATGTINDDDAPEVSISEPSIDEGNGADAPTLEFVVSMSLAWTQDVTVRYSVSGGSATSGVDYESLSATTLTFDSSLNETMKSIRVTVTGDTVYEADETVAITLDQLAGGATFAGAAASITGEGTISNDDNPPLLEIATTNVDEGNSGDTTVLVFDITKTGETDLPVTVGYAIGGTAAASGSDADFTHTVASPVNIPADRSSATIEIDINEDNLAEPDETVIVTLSGHDNHRFAGDADTLAVTGTITNDDFLTLSINSPSANEGGAGEMPSLTFEVTLGAVSTADVTVGYDITGGTAIEGTDYSTFTAGTLTIPAGQTSGTIDVTVIGNDDAGTGKTIEMTLSNPGGGAASEPPPTIETAAGTGTIEDDDGSAVSIDSPRVIEGDSGTSDLVFTVSMSPPSSQAISVSYSVATESTATAGDDYQPLEGGILTFEANHTTPQTITVKVIGDQETEPNETLIVMLSSVTDGGVIAVATGTGTIESDDFGIAIRGPVSPVTEPSGTNTEDLNFTVTLTPASSSAVMVRYSFGGTAVLGADFTDTTAGAVDGVLTFAARETSRIIQAQINSDFADEGEETVTVTLSSDSDVSIESETAEGRIQPASTASSAAVLSAGTPRIAKGENASPPAVEFSLNLDRGQSGVSGAVTVDWALQEVTRTAASGGVLISTLARDVSANNVTTREIATGRATVPATETAATITGNLNAGITLEELRESQILLELGQPSIARVLIEQSDLVPADLLVAAHGNGRVATVVFTISSGEQASGLSYVLSGVGRSAASSLVNIVWDRVSSRRSGSNAAAARLGGRSLDAKALASDGTNGTVREVARLLGIEAVSPDASSAAGYVSGDINAFRKWAGLQDSRKLAANTELSLPLGEGGRGGFAFWGKGGLSSFKGEVEDDDAPAFSYDGQAFSWHFGLDMPLGDAALFGVALTSSSGEVDHSFSGEDQSAGSVETSLTSVSPWLHWSTSGGGDFWAAVSIGSGTAETSGNSAGSVERDISMQVIAVGMRGFSRDLGRRQMAFKADIFTASATASASGQIEETSGSSNRLRVAAESESNRNMNGGGAVSTRLEGGGRYDGGDDDSGFGADALINVEFLSASGRFSVAGKGGLVLFHTKGGFSETHFGGELAYRSDASGRGLQFSLKPEWNAPVYGSMGGLWDNPNTGVRDSSDMSARLKARLGWGVGTLHGRSLATLYGETEDANDGHRLRIGTDLRSTDTAFGNFQFGVYGEREASTTSVRDHTILLKGRLDL